MKKLILLTFIIICIQFTVAQKIYLSYKIKTNDSLWIIKAKAISDKNIETEAPLVFQKYISDPDILFVEDDIKRKFVKMEFNHSTIYPKLLNKGYFSLYEYSQGSNSRYYVCSKTDTTVLDKKDSTLNPNGLYLNQYQKLAAIAKDHPELWPKAEGNKQDTKKIQGFISELNSKYPETSNEIYHKSRFNYLGFSVKGFVIEDKTDLMIEFLKSHYFIDQSPNNSLRYGIRANYYKRTEFFPESWTGWYSIHDGQKDSIFNYRDHYETLTAEIFELPLSVNFEITNSIFTPFFNIGLSPTIYYRTITRTDSEEIDKTTKFTLNAFAATGAKLKLTDNFNILSEFRYDLIKQFNFLIGLEYYFNPKKHP